MRDGITTATKEEQTADIILVKTDSKVYDVYKKDRDEFKRRSGGTMSLAQFHDIINKLYSGSMDQPVVIQGLTIPDTSWSDAAGWHIEREINKLVRENLCYQFDQYYLVDWHLWYGSGESFTGSKVFILAVVKRIIYTEDRQPVRMMEYPVVDIDITSLSSSDSIPNFVTIQEGQEDFDDRYLVVRRSKQR